MESNWQLLKGQYNKQVVLMIIITIIIIIIIITTSIMIITIIITSITITSLQLLPLLNSLGRHPAMGPVEVSSWSQLTRSLEMHCSTMRSFEMEGTVPYLP